MQELARNMAESLPEQCCNEYSFSVIIQVRVAGKQKSSFNLQILWNITLTGKRYATFVCVVEYYFNCVKVCYICFCCLC